MLQLMKQTNFNIANDNIALNYNGMYLDLHNNFDFRSYTYDVTSRQLEFVWTRSHEKWAKENICGFKLVFDGINFLKVRERDSSIPFTEDNCLSQIGFLQQNMRDDFDSFINQEDVTETDDLNIVFQSEQAFKINCISVKFEELFEEVIYVLMTNEGTNVWRPMWADKLEKDVYRIKSFANYDQTAEELQFKPGETVICEAQKKAGGQNLVAVSRK